MISVENHKKITSREGVSRCNWVSAPVDQKNDGATGPRKKLDDIFSRLDTIHERDGQTHGRTSRQTDRHRATAKTALMHSVAR